MSKIFKIMSEQNNNEIITQCVDADDSSKSWTEAGAARTRSARDKIRLALIQARKDGEAGDDEAVTKAIELRAELIAFDSRK
jgi:ribosomal protein S11